MENVIFASRTAALARLNEFVPHAGRNYALRRNYDTGPEDRDHVSRLSPYLRCRLLTEEEVLDAVLARHGPEDAAKFIDEINWRRYWKGWLELRPAVWDDYLCRLGRAWDDVQCQSGLRARWERACLGETGIDCFDAWACELAETGYLHNHARMWFASIWIFTLSLPWELGADFFMRHLLDGDPASNTLSWRWVAGLQTRGKIYLARADNIAKFTQGRFNPDGQLAETASAPDAPPPPEPRALPRPVSPDADLRTGLLLHEEDLSPHYFLGAPKPSACAVLAPRPVIGPLCPAPQVADFRAAALDDALTRLPDLAAKATHVGDGTSILNWARTNRIQQIVTAYAPTGPVASLLDELSATTEAPQLCRIMRPCDRRIWPHATKGFFAFRKKIRI